MLRLLLFLIFFSNYSYSQERYTLNGYITDSESGESLIGATVYINQISSGTITNPYGFYSITLDEGNYDVDFRYIGYQTISRKVELSTNLKIDIELLSSDIELESVVISDVAEVINLRCVYFLIF